MPVNNEADLFGALGRYKMTLKESKKLYLNPDIDKLDRLWQLVIPTDKRGNHVKVSLDVGELYELHEMIENILVRQKAREKELEQLAIQSKDGATPGVRAAAQCILTSHGFSQEEIDHIYSFSPVGLMGHIKGFMKRSEE
jgi:hypothetical protein